MPTDTETSCACKGQGAGSGTLVPGPHFWDPSMPPMAVSLVFPEQVPLLLEHPSPFSIAPVLSPVSPIPSPESQPPRDLDSEVFCDSLEQLEPELVRLPPHSLPSPPHCALAALLPPLDLVTPLSRSGQSRREPLEESLTPETAPRSPQRKVSPCLTLHPLLPFPVILVPQAFP